MNKETMNTIVKPILVLVVICLITSTLLAVTNSFTAPVIAENEAQEAMAAYKTVLPEADSFTDVTADAIAAGASEANIVAVVKADNGAGYAVKCQAKGYGGEVPVVLGFDATGTIVGAEFLQNDESAGFGKQLWDGSAKGTAFAESLVGQSGPVAKGENGVDGVSGATISTKAVITAVNSAFDCVSALQ